MKYASVVCLDPLPYDDKNVLVNMGDYMLTKGIEYIYTRMGINLDKVKKIHHREFTTYDGEYVVLPVNNILVPWYLNRNGITKLSSKIIPVFLGITFDISKFTNKDSFLEMLKKHEPIGCRDDVALKVLQDNNIKSYLNGCCSLTLPRIKVDRSSFSKIYLVDIPEKLLSYIPISLKNNCKIVTHHKSYKKESYNFEVAMKDAEQQYKIYQNTAKMVVTSRLHAALPCIAMGIPVIVVRDYLGFTFSWLDKLIPIYTPENYDKINWDPQIIECEYIKELIVKNACKRIQETYENSSHYKISDFFESRNQRLRTYESCQDLSTKDLFCYLQSTWEKDKKIKYALWGVNNKANEIYNHICREYPNAKLYKVIDSNYEFEFHGIKSEKIDCIMTNNDFFIIVLATNAVEAAVNLFSMLNKPKDQYYLVADIILRG
jgi:hypothetical protein